MSQVRQLRNKSPGSTAGPDRLAALQQYKQRSATYDLELAAFEPIRRLAIDRLELRAGQTVLDIGCGTGLSFAGLHQGVGERGKIIGIEQCPEMIALAGQRISQHAFRNVELLCAPAEEANIGVLADAALFHFTHDILRLPAALDHLLLHLKPGSPVIATGLNWAPPWALPVNLFVWGAALRSVSSLSGLDQPWALLGQRLASLQVSKLLLGAVFVAQGCVR